jgi:hypothetical protein
MVEVSYHCPYCGAVTGVEREGYLADRCVTRESLDGWAYAPAADGVEGDDFTEHADGIEMVCLGDATSAGAGAGGRETTGGSGGADDPDPDADGCGRTYYVSFVRFENGQEIDPDVPLEDYPDRPRFDFG